MKLRQLFIISIFVASIPVGIYGQTEDIDEDIQFHSKELDRIRREIKNFEKRIGQKSDREKTTLQRVNELDEEISLVRNLIYRLRKEEKSKIIAIEQAEKKITKNEEEYKDLQERYAQRAVDIYMKGRLSDLELILDAGSWRRAMYRTKYLKIISEYDKSIARKIDNSIKEINADKTRLTADFRDLKKIDNEKSAYKKSLERNRRARARELEQVKKDKQALARRLEDRKSSAKEIEKIMAKLEKEKAARLAELERRRREEERLLVGGNFSAIKGKLPWPVEGKILSRFGSHRNPILKTVTENSGIDIKGKAGSEVRAVFDGIVTTVTYIRGYGNTIIIDHGGGFYTVYTHVVDVEVEENMYVDVREVIAHVGDSGSFDGAKLHFEIWGNRQKLNPELWLKKS
ncbi:MAG: peptidoglycan DD-metalloendopeptidase family protein [Candidatus Marinimicrobia bacterium]|nr:peptidoglycan DD-metalloendopeptidase family protein [Candidatus Neomarinimicrobiota bacterium]